MPVPANASFASLSAPSTWREEQVGAHRLQLDRHLRAGVVTGDHALELVATLAAQRKYEQLLRDGIGI